MLFGPSVAGELDEIDATPRPLRISKREDRNHGNPHITNASPLPDSNIGEQVQGKAFPGVAIRRDGYSHAPKGGILEIPKQRNTRCRALGSTMSPQSPAWEKWSSESDRRSHKANGPTIRATTVGSLIDTDLLSRQRFVSPAIQTRTVSNRPLRAFTADALGFPFPLPATLQQQSPPNPRPQPTLRSRLLSKVMIGVTGKPHQSHAVRERTSNLKKSHRKPDLQMAPLKSSQAPSSRPMTSSSLESNMTFDYDLDVALAAFPSPPKSTVTSPTTVSSFESTRMASSLARTLVGPRTGVMPCAQLNVLPEADRLGSEGDQTVLVAVDIVGTVAPTAPQPNPAVQRVFGLDIAVVIDNSLFASPSTLMANCETARFIASLLDATTDRLAVLCTRPIIHKAKDFNVISQLSRYSIRCIKSTVDAIMTSTDKPEPAALGMAIGRAIELLTKDSNYQSDNEPGGEAYGHVFILTTNPTTVPSTFLNHKTVQVHIISSGAVPWKDCSGPACNGWKLAPLCSNSIQYMSVEKDKDRNSLFNRIRDLMSYARSGECQGRLTDVVLEVETTQQCTVEAIMGVRHIASLRPGEVITALVKVNVGGVFAKGYTLSPSLSMTSSNSPEKARDVFEELDVMLGASPTPILIAKLTYKLSLLPAGTRCSTIAAASLKRSLPNTQENPHTAMAINHGAAESRRVVQKRLIYHLATNQTPKQALLALREYFGEEGCESCCPQYFKLITEELKYQSRIMERFDLPSPIKGGVPCIRDASPCDHVGQGPCTGSGDKPESWLTSISDGQSSSRYTPKSPTNSSHIFEARNGSKYDETSPLTQRRLGVSMPSCRQAGVPISTRRAKGPPSSSKRTSLVSHPTTSGDSSDEPQGVWVGMQDKSKSSRALAELDRPNSTNDQKEVFKGHWIRDLAIRKKKAAGPDDAVHAPGTRIGKGRENSVPLADMRSLISNGS